MAEKSDHFTIARVSGAAVSGDELLADLSLVAKDLKTEILSQRTYSEHGRFDVSTITRRFGSWNKALMATGLSGANEINYSDEVLFENIMRLWEHYGRQPRRAELALSPSTISQSPYRRRFRSWIDALHQFADYANAADAVAPTRESVKRARTSREPSLRLRFLVLKRDDFRCRACGASPATSPGLHLHIDHIVPWSAGGATVAENLQTLCEPCNLGKSNI